LSDVSLYRGPLGLKTKQNTQNKTKKPQTKPKQTNKNPLKTQETNNFWNGQVQFGIATRWMQWFGKTAGFQE